MYPMESAKCRCNSQDTNWTRCADDATAFYADIDQGTHAGVITTHESSVIQHIMYENPIGGLAPYTAQQVNGIRATISELAMASRVVATSTGTNDVFIATGNSEMLLTPGYGEACGTDNIASKTSFYFWHHSFSGTTWQGNSTASESHEMSSFPSIFFLPDAVRFKLSTRPGGALAAAASSRQRRRSEQTLRPAKCCHDSRCSSE